MAKPETNSNDLDEWFDFDAKNEPPVSIPELLEEHKTTVAVTAIGVLAAVTTMAIAKNRGNHKDKE